MHASLKAFGLALAVVVSIFSAYHVIDLKYSNTGIKVDSDKVTVTMLNGRVQELDSKLAGLEFALDQNIELLSALRESIAGSSKVALTSTQENEAAEGGSDSGIGKKMSFVESFKQIQQQSDAVELARVQGLEQNFFDEVTDEAWSAGVQHAIDDLFLTSSTYQDIQVEASSCRSSTCKISATFEGSEIDADEVESELIFDMHKLGLSELRSVVRDDGVRYYYASKTQDEGNHGGVSNVGF